MVYMEVPPRFEPKFNKQSISIFTLKWDLQSFKRKENYDWLSQTFGDSQESPGYVKLVDGCSSKFIALWLDHCVMKHIYETL